MKTKNRLFINLVAIACCFLLFNFESYSQTYRYDGEIMGEVIGVDEQDEWLLRAQCNSMCKWEMDKDNIKCIHTSDHQTAFIEGVGNHPSINGFKSPCGHKDHENDIAFGYYQFTFDLPGTSNDKSFSLDLRDADWSGDYQPKDIFIRYNVSSGALSRKKEQEEHIIL